MRRFRFSTAAVVLFTVLALGTFCFGELLLEIEVAPATLNIQSEGAVVTVHTDIAYGAVDVYTVYLNSIAIQSWKADNQGNFVAKFSMEAVKTLDGLVIGDYNTLQLVGLTKEDGEAFSGEAEILVIDVQPEGKGKEK